jgi:uncharacterized protein YoxC
MWTEVTDELLHEQNKYRRDTCKTMTVHNAITDDIKDIPMDVTSLNTESNLQHFLCLSERMGVERMADYRKKSIRLIQKSKPHAWK